MTINTLNSSPLFFCCSKIKGISILLITSDLSEFELINKIAPLEYRKIYKA